MAITGLILLIPALVFWFSVLLNIAGIQWVMPVYNYLNQLSDLLQISIALGCPIAAVLLDIAARMPMSKRNEKGAALHGIIIVAGAFLSIYALLASLRKS